MASVMKRGPDAQRDSCSPLSAAGHGRSETPKARVQFQQFNGNSGLAAVSAAPAPIPVALPSGTLSPATDLEERMAAKGSSDLEVEVSALNYIAQTLIVTGLLRQRKRP